MCKMKILLKTRGHHQENVKLTNISQFVKFYLSTHNIIKQPEWTRHGIYVKIILHVKEI